MKIMIVEDHEAVRASLRDFLNTAMPGSHVLEAATGEEALEVAFDEEPEVVLMDLGLPGMTGLEATRRLTVVAPRSRVVVCSVHEGSVYKQAALAAGAVGFVPKREANERLVPLIRTLRALAPAGAEA
ncbi:MAG: response regulator [Acidobacteriota bacterium]